MYLRDREPARTFPVICGPYQMRPKSFHHLLRTYVVARTPLFLSFSPARSLRASSPTWHAPPASLRRAREGQKSLRSSSPPPPPPRSSRIMYPPADLFSIATLTPSTRGNPLSHWYVLRYGRAAPILRYDTIRGDRDIGFSPSRRRDLKLDRRGIKLCDP